MNDIQVFSNEKFGKVRTVMKDGEPWFVAADVCKALELDQVSNAVRKLDEDEKTLISVKGIWNGVGNPNVRVVNEPGLYSLVLSSRQKEAKEFKRWITHEVIPSIRKHGIYATPSAAEKILSDPDYGIKLLEAIKAERAEKEKLAQKVQEMLPKANYCDVVLSSEDLIPTTVIAKDYGFTAKKFNRMLHDLGVQFKKGRYWHLYDKYANEGYAQSKTYVYPGKKKDHVVKVDTQWTQPGRMFIYDLLKGVGILPIVEREAV